MLTQNVRYAIRSLQKARGFTIIAVLTLALGIGAIVTVFSVVDAVMLQPLPFHEPDRLVRLWETTPQGADFSTSEPDYLEFQRQSRTLQGLAAFRQADLSLTGQGEPRRLRGMAATHTLFPVLGVAPELGRTFSAAEDESTPGPPVVVLSHALWRSLFEARPSAIGQTLILDGTAHTIVGVMPPSFAYPAADVWIPLHAGMDDDRTDHSLDVVGRLEDGIPLATARADLARLAGSIGAQHASSQGWGVRLSFLSDAIVGPQVRRAGWVLLGAAALLLLLACANVANLLLARATTRRAEMAVRAALGAGRGVLLRQLLTESTMLAALGGGLGLIVSSWGVGAAHILGAGRIPRLDAVALDGRVLTASLALCLLTSLAFGLAPALRSSRVEARTALGEDRRSGASRAHRRSRDGLVVLQVTLALVLLVGAGLMLRSFARLNHVDLGFDPARVVRVDLQLPAPKYDDVRRTAFFDALLARLDAVPGVQSAGATAVDPFSGWNFSNDVTPESRAAATPETGFAQAAWRSVTPDFFRAMGIPLLRGRTFTAADGAHAARVVVVSKALARELWPGADATGRRLYWGGTSGRPWTVIGVVGELRDVRVEDSPSPMVFLPYAQVPLPDRTLVVRGSGVGRLAGAVRGAIRGLDPLLPIPDIRPLQENRSRALAGPRFNTVLLTSFALMALLLAASGIYAVMAFNVAQRRREIGIRLAVGAQAGDVVGRFVRSAMWLAMLGVGAGSLLGWGLARLLAGLLYGIQPTDPVTFLAVPALLAAVVVAAAFFPAREISRIDPVEVLRRE
jgi:putative ABC transport system permease protein